MKPFLPYRLSVFSAALALLGVFSSVSASVVAGYTFEGSLSSVVAAEVATASDFSRGEGLLSAGSAFLSFGEGSGQSLRQYNGMGKPLYNVGNDLAASIVGKHFYSFTITAGPEAIGFDTLSFSHYLRDTFMQNSVFFHVCIDVDNNGFDTGDELQSIALVEDAWGSVSIDLSRVSRLNPSSSLEFRIYMTDAGLENFKSVVIDDLVVTAKAQSKVDIPESRAYALIVGLCGLTCVALRRRR